MKRDDLRKVEFQYYQYNTGKSILSAPLIGYFHTWASESEESNNGSFGNYAVAIVECENGGIEKVRPEHIKFIS